MDEIDAALDFKNVSIVANYIKERTKNAQFVIISLRNNMFELADRLVGIYKTNDTTKSVTINPKLFCAPEVERLSRQVERADSNPLRNLTNLAAATN
jgi:structural maintenance of chromosome 4